MSAFEKSLGIAVAAITLVVSAGAVVVSAQGPWVAPPEAKATEESRSRVSATRRRPSRPTASRATGPGGKGDGPAAAALPAPKPANWTSAKRPETDRRRDLLEDVERPRRHAAVEAPPGERALGDRELHSNPEGEVTRPVQMSTRPAGNPGGASSLSAMRLCAIDVGSNTVRLLVAEVIGGGQLAHRRPGPDHHAPRGEPRAHRRARRCPDGAHARGGARLRRARRAPRRERDPHRGHERGSRSVERSRLRGRGRARHRSARRRGQRRGRGAPHAPRRRVTGSARLSGVVLTFDIGGGSTEYVLSEGDAIRSMISLRLGVVPLAERFPFPGIADRALYRELYDEVRRRLGRELPEAIRSARVAHLIGTAGHGDGAGGARPRPPPLRSRPRAGARAEPRQRSSDSWIGCAG